MFYRWDWVCSANRTMWFLVQTEISSLINTKYMEKKVVHIKTTTWKKIITKHIQQNTASSFKSFFVAFFLLFFEREQQRKIWSSKNKIIARYVSTATRSAYAKIYFVAINAFAWMFSSKLWFVNGAMICILAACQRFIINAAVIDEEKMLKMSEERKTWQSPQPNQKIKCKR